MIRSLFHSSRCWPARPQSIFKLENPIRLRALYQRGRRPPYPPQYQHAHETYEEHFLGPSRTTRILRSLRWAFIFGLAGAAASQYYNWWIYRKMGEVKVDSPLDAAMIADIMKQIDESEMVQAFKEDSSFTEIWPLCMPEETAKAFMTPNNLEAHQHFLFTALRGTRGIFPRAFYCESRGILCMVVGLGYGVEQWPNMPHEGIVSTVVLEGMRVLAQAWFPSDSNWKVTKLDLNFTLPLPPEPIICVTIMPASTVKDLPELFADPEKYGSWPAWLNTTDFSERVNMFVAYTNRSGGHPLHDKGTSYGHAACQFEVESDDWPPKLPLQLDMEGNWK